MRRLGDYGRFSVTALFGAALCGAAATAQAGPVLTVATFAFPSSNTQSNVVQTTDGSAAELTIGLQGPNAASGEARASASLQGLGVLLDLDRIDHGVLAAFSGQVRFDALPGSGLTEASVTFSVDVHGAFVRNFNSSVGWTSELRLVAVTPSTISQLACDVSGCDTSTLSGQVDYTHAITRTVPLGQDVLVAAELRTTIVNGPFLSARSDFLNTLAFDPDAFFTIHTPGVTVSSVDGDWLVNNRLANAAEEVSEPSALALLIAGALGLAARRRGRSRC